MSPSQFLKHIKSAFSELIQVQKIIVRIHQGQSFLKNKLGLNGAYNVCTHK